MNRILVYPNPTNNILFIDNGDYSSMTEYSIRIINQLGAEVFNNKINQKEFQISMEDFGSTGIFYLQIIDPVSQVIEVRKILLE